VSAAHDPIQLVFIYTSLVFGVRRHRQSMVKLCQVIFAGPPWFQELCWRFFGLSLISMASAQNTSNPVAVDTLASQPTSNAPLS